VDGGDVIILGAGFSKAIFPEMPTLDELGTLSIKRAGLTDDPLIPILSSPSGFTFETWLATLAEPQPYLRKLTTLQTMHSSGMLKVRLSS
jgi:hypothetical protein